MAASGVVTMQNPGMESEESRLETQELIRRFTEEASEEQPNDPLLGCLKRTTDEKEMELELQQPWKYQYESDMPVFVYSHTCKEPVVSDMII